MSTQIPFGDHIGLWANELSPWLPDCIFDGHVHLSPSDVIAPITPERRKEGLCAFPEYRWEDARAAYENLFPGKKIGGIFGFPLPLREVRLEDANQYILDLMRHHSELKGFILAHPTDARRTIAQFEEAQRAGLRFSGVKPYYDLLGKSNYETTMPEFIPEELLEFMHAERLLMMLHTSGIGVGDTQNQIYLKSVALRYPQIRIVLAHMGRYLKPEQFDAFMASSVMQSCPNLFLDTSYVTLHSVYRSFLAHRELWPRLLFGTDFPYGLWVQYERSPDVAGPATHNAYHVIKAIKDVIEELHLDQDTEAQLKADIFCQNAQRGASARRLGGRGASED